MDKTQAQNSIKKLSEDSSSLEPSALLSLFEIDLTDLIQSKQRVINSDLAFADLQGQTILRFHNNVKLVQSSIWFGYDLNAAGTMTPPGPAKEYFAAPIRADGFEASAKGSPPNPKLSISVNFDGLPSQTANRLKYLKLALRDLDDLVGAKVSRIRTFAKYINCSNFYTDCSASSPSQLRNNQVIPPEGWHEDINAYFPVDVFYIDRKSQENKNHVELELASPFDAQELKLPARIVTEKTCTWRYRGEGCCYEYNAVKIADAAEHTAHSSIFYNDAGSCKAVPTSAPYHGMAPPAATYKDESIQAELAQDGYTYQAPANNAVPETWDNTVTYAPGTPVRIKLKGINYYYVSRRTPNIGHPPPDDHWWYSDQCSKSLIGCRLRWKANPILGNMGSSPLPFGGFPTSRRSVK